MTTMVTGWLVAIAIMAGFTLWATWHHAKTRRYIADLELALRNADTENTQLRAELQDTVPYETFNGYVAALMSQMGGRRVVIPNHILESFAEELVYIHHDIECQQTSLQLQGPCQSIH